MPESVQSARIVKNSKICQNLQNLPIALFWLTKPKMPERPQKARIAKTYKINQNLQKGPRGSRIAKSPGPHEVRTALCAQKCPSKVREHLERPCALENVGWPMSSDDIQLSLLSSLCPLQTQCQHPHSISALQAQTQHIENLTLSVGTQRAMPE